MREQTQVAPETNAAPTRGERLRHWGFLAALFVAALFAGLWIAARIGFRGDEAGRAQVLGPRRVVELRGDEPMQGPHAPLVRVVVFSDYQCPYCARAHGPLHAALEDEQDVQLVVKHLPLPSHPRALVAAKLAWAAHQLGMFWAVVAALYANAGRVEPVLEQAGALGLDVEQLRRDATSPEAAVAIDNDLLAAGKASVVSTPTFIVNGHVYRGAQTESAWHNLLDDERDAAQELLDRGVAREQLLQTLINEDAQAAQTVASEKEGA